MVFMEQYIYIGVTSNLVKRIYEHKNSMVDGFSKRHGLKLLVYYEVYESIYNAIEREKYLKRKSRSYKLRLIEKDNLKWEDLYDGIL
ncbi:GIY-YIG nuclease family protein [bacterium]|nr:GIY-YIG nuclease family protein [bacterium]